MEQNEKQECDESVPQGSQVTEARLIAVGHIGNRRNSNSCLTGAESPFGFPVFIKKE